MAFLPWESRTTLRGSPRSERESTKLKLVPYPRQHRLPFWIGDTRSQRAMKYKSYNNCQEECLSISIGSSTNQLSWNIRACLQSAINRTKDQSPPAALLRPTPMHSMTRNQTGTLMDPKLKRVRASTKRHVPRNIAHGCDSSCSGDE